MRAVRDGAFGKPHLQTIQLDNDGDAGEDINLRKSANQGDVIGNVLDVILGVLVEVLSQDSYSL